MSEHIYLSDNSENIRKELESLGFRICHCASFIDAKWLSVYYNHNIIENSVHGAGYGCECECEGMCFQKCIMCNLVKNEQIIHIFPDIKSLKEYLKLND